MELADTYADVIASRCSVAMFCAIPDGGYEAVPSAPAIDVDWLAADDRPLFDRWVDDPQSLTFGEWLDKNRGRF